MPPIYVVEHCEEDWIVTEWGRLEYNHVISSVGVDNLIITNFPARLRPRLCDAATRTEDRSIAELGLNPSEVCLFDMRGAQDVEPEDANRFKYFLFGGVLGGERRV